MAYVGCFVVQKPTSFGEDVDSTPLPAYRRLDTSVVIVGIFSLVFGQPRSGAYHSRDGADPGGMFKAAVSMLLPYSSVLR